MSCHSSGELHSAQHYECVVAEAAGDVRKRTITAAAALQRGENLAAGMLGGGGGGGRHINRVRASH